MAASSPSALDFELLQSVLGEGPRSCPARAARWCRSPTSDPTGASGLPPPGGGAGRDVHVPLRHGRDEGQSGAHAQPAPLPALIALHLARDRRPRAHQRHIAPQHVPQLRPFVDRKLTQHPPDSRQPRIVRYLERGLTRIQMLERRLQTPPRFLPSSGIYRTQIAAHSARNAAGER